MFNPARGNAVDCLVPFLLEYNWAKLIPNVYRVSSCWPTTNVVEIVINDMHNYERQKHRHNLLRLPRQSNSKPIYEAVSQANSRGQDKSQLLLLPLFFLLFVVGQQIRL